LDERERRLLAKLGRLRSMQRQVAELEGAARAADQAAREEGRDVP
jgi:hypothetical protein